MTFAETQRWIREVNRAEHNRRLAKALAFKVADDRIRGWAWSAYHAIQNDPPEGGVLCTSVGYA